MGIKRGLNLSTVLEKNQTPSALRPLFEDPHVHNRIEGGRGGGKTRGIAQLLVDIMSVAPLQLLCCREVMDSIAKSSYKVLKEEIFRQGKGHLFEITKTEIRSSAGAVVSFTGLLQHTVDSIKSYEGYHWAWVEEAQSVCKESLDILIPTLRTDGYFEHDGFVFPLRMFIYTLNP